MFSGESFLEFARECAVQHRSEAADRSVISRAYYAVFWSARDYWTQELQLAVSPGPGAHKEVFRIVESAKGNRFSDRLRRLHALRKRADYEQRHTGSSNDVQVVLDEASELVSALNVL